MFANCFSRSLSRSLALSFIVGKGDLVNIISQSSMVSVLAESPEVLRAVGARTLQEMGLGGSEDVMSVTSSQTPIDAFRLMSEKVQ